MTTTNTPTFAVPFALERGQENLIEKRRQTHGISPAVTLAALVGISFAVWASVLLLLLT